MEYVNKTISIKKIHSNWVNKNSINLSRFVQKKIDIEIKNRTLIITKLSRSAKQNKAGK